MARLRNARKVNCVFCKSVRYDIARDAGLSEDKVQMIEDGYNDSELSEREKLVLAFTDQYLNDPGAITGRSQGPAVRGIHTRGTGASVDGGSPFQRILPLRRVAGRDAG